MQQYLILSVSSPTGFFVSRSFLIIRVDTVRRRVQMESEKTPIERRYTGVKDCAQKVWQLEGAHGLYKGFLLNVVRTIGSSLVLVLYGEAHTIAYHHTDHQ